MSTPNNFKRIQEEDEERYADRTSRVQNSLWQTLGVFKLMGDVVEIYLPKVFDVLIAASGGRPESTDRPPGARPSGSSRPGPENSPGRPPEDENAPPKP